MFRRGKPQTYAQAWLAAAISAVLVGAVYSVFGIFNNWGPPWLQFAIMMPAWLLVVNGLFLSYGIRRRRASARRG